MTTAFQTDVAIIGAGPVGLFAVFECGMLKMRCHVIDALADIGGQCAALYPEKPIYDIPGFPAINAGALIENLHAQGAPFAPVYHLDQQAVTCKKTSQGFELTTSKNVTIHAKAIIIAGGAGAFGPNKPPLENLAAYEGKSVFYMVGKRENFRGKKIVIAGGGDSAVDWAISLAEIAAKIYFVHRRPKFRAAPESVARLEALTAQGKVEMVVPYQLCALKGNNGILTHVEVKDMDENPRLIEADVLLPFFGLATALGPLAEWGLTLDQHRIATDPTTAETNIKGIFAVGDIASYPNKLKLILTGFSEAAMAAHAIYPLVFSGQALHFEYSTSKGLPTS